MAKKTVTQDKYDYETGEVFEEDRPLVDFSEVQAHLEELRAADPGKRFEYPDPRPMAPPLGYRPEPSLAERIRMMVRSEHLRYAAQNGEMETFEEADDFDVDDDFDPTSPYEMFFDPPAISPEHASANSGQAGRPGGGAGGPDEGPQAAAERGPVGATKGGSPPSGDPPVTAAKS